MSKIRDELFGILSLYFSEKGFSFVKSKNQYKKVVDGIEYQFDFKIDGRGGLSVIDWINYSVSIVEIKKILKKILKLTYDYPYLQGRIESWVEKDRPLRIPTMYSKSALDLANVMNLKELGKMDFYEKYPKERIKNCALRIIKIYKEIIEPYFHNYNTYDDIYKTYMIEDPNNDDENPLEIGKYDTKELNYLNVMYINLLSKRLGKDQPKILSNYDIHKFGKLSNLRLQFEEIENYIF